MLMPRLSALVLACTIFSSGYAQIEAPSLEHVVAEEAFAKTRPGDTALPAFEQGARVALDEPALRRSATPALRGGLRSAELSVELAVAPGMRERFLLRETGGLHPDLRAKYPDLRTYEGRGLTDPKHTIRAEYSEAAGWSYAVRTPAGRVAVEAERGKAGAERVYRIYAKSADDLSGFACHVEDAAAEAVANLGGDIVEASRSAGDCQLRRYRLAITCTGEYARAVDGNTPTVAGVIAAMNVAVNRVNEVYERDLGITLELVPDNDQLVFLNGATDPYTEGSPGAMIGEAGPQIDAIIGNAAYDVGHIFSTQGGGLARLNSPCDPDIKARGVTGIPQPVGDPFYIDYVAHELGHQFGATHTFNNSCGGNRSPSTAFEPGSGSSIMAYAGICAPNVQNRSDDYFHAASILQIAAFVTSTSGNCAQIVPTNNSPAAITSTNQSYSVPIGTPFELTAEATDAEGDPLTYAWDQYDNETGQTMPPVPTNTEGPTFRSLGPTVSPTRRFPNPASGEWEVIPAVERDMSFVLTVRDNNASVGCTSEDFAQVASVGDTPFRVTSYNAPAAFDGLATATVTWDVADTDILPIDAPFVDIYFSTDRGATYAATVASRVPNNGSRTVTVPNVATTTGRFVVKGHEHIFLDFNDADITVTETAMPTFNLLAADPTQGTCDLDEVAYAVQVESVLGFSGSVDLSTVGVPTGLGVTITENNRAAGFATEVRITGVSQLPDGGYDFQLVGVSGSERRSVTLTIVKTSVPADAPTGLAPADGARLGTVVTAFSWSYDASVGPVVFQFSGDPNFIQNVFERNLSTPGISLSGIPEGVFFWRVAYENACGRGPWGPLQSFREIALEEEVYTNGTAVPISSGGPARYESTVTATRTGPVYRVALDADIRHTYVGDLRGEYRLPGGSDEPLFAAPSGGGCSGDNLGVTFSDDATATPSDFVGGCTGGDPSIAGTFLPLASFYPGLPAEGSGDYTLVIFDEASADGGAIESFSARLSYEREEDFGTDITLSRVRLPAGGSADITAARLSVATNGAAPANTFFIVKRVPTVALLVVGGINVGVGQVFSQEQINQGIVGLVHDVSSPLNTDELVVDVVARNGEYVPNVTLGIDVVAAPLTVAVSVDAEVACFGGSNGALSAVAAGGTPPYTFSLNQNPGVSGGTFAGLSAGSYTVVVTDADGSSATSQTLILAQPDELSVQASATGNDIVATGTGGTGALAYSIDGNSFQASGDFDDVDNGSYTVTVRDDNGCTATTQVVVSVDALVVDLTVTTPISCNGDRATLEAIAAGGVPPYRYAITGRAAQSSPTFSDVAGGSYALTVTDADGNSATTSSPLVIEEPDAVTATADATGSDVDVDAAGGTPPYVYSLGGGVFQDEDDFFGLTNGTYDILVRDANGCETTTTVTVSVNNIVVVADVTRNVTCFSESDGEITVSASGGVAPYTYSLSTGMSQSSPTFSNLTAGVYNVTVTDADGLTAATTISVVEPPELAAVLTVSGNVISISPSGGTAPYTITSSVPANPDGTYGPVPSGTYVFTVTDANGCTLTQSTTIGMSDLAIEIVSLTATESCPGANDGSVQVAATGGVTPYSYAVDGMSFGAASTFANLPVGSYTVTVRDAVGDQAQVTFDIERRDAPTADITVDGSRVTVSNVSPAGFTYEYSFDGGTTFGSIPVGYIYSAGTFDVLLAYDGCRVPLSVTVTDPLTLEQSAPLVVCPGNTVAQGAVCVSGGSGATDLVVASANAQIAATGAAACGNGFDVSSSAGATQVELTVTDATGATRTLVLPVVAAEPFDIDATLNGDDLQVDVAGGTGPFSFSVDGTNFQADGIFPDLPPGRVVLTVRDGFGCTSTEVFTVSSAAELASGIGLVAYPNPFEGVLRVRVDAAVELRELQLFDAAGRQVLAKAVRGVTADLSTRTLRAGYYTLVVRHEGGRVHVPVIRH